MLTVTVVKWEGSDAAFLSNSCSGKLAVADLSLSSAPLPSQLVQDERLVACVCLKCGRFSSTFKTFWFGQSLSYIATIYCCIYC